MLYITVLKCTHSNSELHIALSEHAQETNFPSNLISQFETTARSQYKVVRYIKEHPHIPVIYENNENLKDKNLTKILKRIFPQGLPVSYNKLNYQQKRFLANYGGASIAVNCGIISETYSDNTFYVSHQDQFSKKFNIKPGEYQEKIPDSIRIDQAREYLSLENAICIAEQSNSNNITFVSGGIHQYEDVATCFPHIKLKVIDHSCLNTPSEFRDLLQPFIKRYDTLRLNNFNCEYAQHMLTTPPSVNDRCSFLPSPYDMPQQQNNDSYYMAAGTVALLFLSALSIFNCCRKFINRSGASENKEEETSRPKMD